MDFTDKNLWPFIKVGNLQLYVTESLLATWIVMALLIGFAIVVRIRLRTFKQVPTGFQAVVEAMVDAVNNMVKSMMGPGFGQYGGIFFAMFAFILMSNYASMFGLRSPTSNIATTGAMALTTFTLTQVIGFRHSGGKYFKDLVSPSPIFLPLNIIGDLAKPVSLCFRLFGNILSGVIIFGLVYFMFPVLLRFGVPSFMHVYFDVFVGALQAYIFTVLSMAFIQQKAVLD